MSEQKALQDEIESLDQEIHELEAEKSDKQEWINYYYDEANNIDPEEFSDHFDEFVKSCEGDEIRVMGVNFNPAEVLKELDPIAYHQALMEYVENHLDKENTEQYQVYQTKIDQLEDEIEDIDERIKSLEEKKDLKEDQLQDLDD